MQSMWKLLAAGLTLALLCSQSGSAAQNSLILVAGKDSYDAARSWVSYLEKNGVSVTHVAAKDLPKFKDQKFIVLMGSPGEADGVGDVLKETLSPQEMAWLREEGNGRLYIKGDIWTKGQTILVFAGQNQRAAEVARKDSHEEWWMLIADAFDIKLDPKMIHGY